MDSFPFTMILGSKAYHCIINNGNLMVGVVSSTYLCMCCTRRGLVQEFPSPPPPKKRNEWQISIIQLLLSSLQPVTVNVLFDIGVFIYYFKTTKQVWNLNCRPWCQEQAVVVRKITVRFTPSWFCKSTKQHN